VSFLVRADNLPARSVGLQLPQVGRAVPWLHLDRWPDPSGDFTFALLSDRTGFARPGVFERGVEITNLLRPDFIVQIGDCIEGYTADADEVARQWDEFDAITAHLEVPLFRVPGNHDVSNEVMRAEWVRRYGVLHYHFVYRDVLFLVLDTSDPPQTLADFLPVESGSDTEFLAELQALAAVDPAGAAARVEALIDWEGTMPARLSDEQIAWAESVLAEQADARWTVLCMHMPAWQGREHPGLHRLRTALGDRPFTMFAGHVHNYRHTLLDGRDHIRLGPTGGMWVQTRAEGNVDHVTLVTMTSDGPRLANLALDGVFGRQGRPRRSSSAV
jgi:3',5'-cyclic AMP phosphodiesterase CpdA